jgi:hypothetical protein
VRAYRQQHRVRSRTHPVPELRAADGWIEAPFWVWRAGDRVRRRLFARPIAGGLEISDGLQTLAELPLPLQTPAGAGPGRLDGQHAIHELGKLAERGIRLRTRALSTTLFARLCLADLFVHGLGGAIYDEMTDEIISRFFGIEAPVFLTLSATIHLPIARHNAEPRDAQRLVQQLRELDYHAERYLNGEPAEPIKSLITQKQALIAAQQAARTLLRSDRVHSGRTSREGPLRQRRLLDVNRQLAQHALNYRHQLEEELAQVTRHVGANAVLEFREFAGCLYPADKLRRFVNHVCASIRK